MRVTMNPCIHSLGISLVIHRRVLPEVHMGVVVPDGFLRILEHHHRIPMTTTVGWCLTMCVCGRISCCVSPNPHGWTNYIQTVHDQAHHNIQRGGKL